MADAEDLVWFAEQDERYPHYQVPLFLGVLFLALPVAALVDDGVVIALVMVVPFLIFVGVIVRDYRSKSRAVVRVRLVPSERPAEVVVSRADGGIVTHPVGALRKLEVESVAGYAGEFRRMCLFFDDGVEYTRAGRADDAEQWAAALHVLEIKIEPMTSLRDQDDLS
ncbi:hypothetical protein [Actinoplanes sp. NPDC049681]|uniref:hypothetical protein n=1 Tax=Actinoplanes sp. NPDC049681 TaxID=3363905 RepID=UPI0037B13634